MRPALRRGSECIGGCLLRLTEQISDRRGKRLLQHAPDDLLEDAERGASVLIEADDKRVILVAGLGQSGARRAPTDAVHEPGRERGVDLYLDRDLFPEAFAADVDRETAAVMAATQERRRGGHALGGPSRRGTCWAPRTEPFRLQGSDSWPSVGTRRSRR